MRQPLLLPIIYEGVECYQVYEDYPFTVDGVTYTVPKGLVVDGASVPRWLWSFRPPDGQHRAGALAHDWLYINKGSMPERLFARKECDGVFLDMMLQSGVSWWDSHLMYRGVRMGGWAVWDKPIKPPIIIPVRNQASRHMPSYQITDHLYS